MHRHFEEQLSGLRGRLVHMGALAEAMIEKAVKSLLERTTARHPEIFKNEDEVNALHIEIDEKVITLLALQHPLAADLRLVVMGSKIAGELERIGDQAVNICQNTEALLRYPPLKPLIDIPLMAEIARRMLRESLDAFVRQDAALAQKVLDADDEVDAFKEQIFRELLTYMMSDPGTIPRALALILISRNLERVGDHATNIAEEVIYVAQGRDVRHHHEEKKRDGNEGKG
ncbi:MAG TPA: phosphate signaling complex protein PhoU [Planctomycetota bacterium]|nr:phosphate signaling complex protein PhoU [Planctomycetota bacterium]